MDFSFGFVCFAESYDLIFAGKHSGEVSKKVMRTCPPGSLYTTSPIIGRLECRLIFRHSTFHPDARMIMQSRYGPPVDYNLEKVFGDWVDHSWLHSLGP